ncbi:hypothetical protein AYO44_01125 [Planctomycetaceae bacterium SCGC AG-212-F19]|nr:hypothetical protein AYO44_01125 [Planctomycetaceae bacterium SCGC AG-212-F19]
MLRITTSPYRLCDGMNRRDFLHAGALGATGLTLPALLQARAGAAGAPKRKPKACILLFMDGGPPQMDTFDMKPEAPPEIRGEFKPIATNIPGIQVSDHLPMVAKHADKLAVVRSVSFDQTVGSHGGSVYLTLTGGHVNPRVGDRDDVRPSPDDFPNIGAVLASMRPTTNGLPPFVWLLDMYRSTFAGEGAGFLGKKFEPFRILQDPNQPKFKVQSLSTLPEVPLERLDNRRQLLDTFHRQADAALRAGGTAGLGAPYERAFDLLLSAEAKKAFDLNDEPAAVRDRYGRTKFGQGVLMARRLIEAGVPLVNVFWNGEEVPGGWDLHYNSYKNLRVLMPSLDRAWSALLEDLAQRGLLEDTLVVWMGEFGRAPKIEEKGGRGHWGRCYSVVFAGAGIQGGQVYGRSDRQAGFPVENRVSPADIVTTMYHCLGIDTDTELRDQFGRPLRLCQGGVIAPIVRSI